MELGLDKEKLLEYRDAALKHLSDPLKLRLLVVGGLALLIVAAAYMPLSDQIAERRRLLKVKRQRLDAIGEVESLRAEAASYREHLPKGSDTNEWVQYILGGLRETHVKLRDMASKTPKKVGPYRTVTLAIEVEGTYAELKGFMEWLDKSSRLLRVDSTRLQKQSESLTMRLVLLGLVQGHAKSTG